MDRQQKKRAIESVQMKLHKLSNGNWIDLQTVTSVYRAGRIECWPGGPIHPDRIVVRCGQQYEIIPCDDADQAAVMMDELAGLVNTACK